MSPSREREWECPRCEGMREFCRAAGTRLGLGTEEKWRCTECDYCFVVIGDIDTSVASAQLTVVPGRRPADGYSSSRACQESSGSRAAAT